MLTAGEDPLYIARRCIVMASEDVGLGNNAALPLARLPFSPCALLTRRRDIICIEETLGVSS